MEQDDFDVVIKLNSLDKFRSRPKKSSSDKLSSKPKKESEGQHRLYPKVESIDLVKSQETEYRDYNFEELPEDVRLDIEIQYLKSLRKNKETRDTFHNIFPSVQSFYGKVIQFLYQDDINVIIKDVYFELLKSIRSVLNASNYDKSIKLIFSRAVSAFTTKEEIQTVEPYVTSDDKTNDEYYNIASMVFQEIKNNYYNQNGYNELKAFDYIRDFIRRNNIKINFSRIRLSIYKICSSLFFIIKSNLSFVDSNDTLKVYINGKISFGLYYGNIKDDIDNPLLPSVETDNSIEFKTVDQTSNTKPEPEPTDEELYQIEKNIDHLENEYYALMDEKFGRTFYYQDEEDKELSNATSLHADEFIPWNDVYYYNSMGNCFIYLDKSSESVYCELGELIEIDGKLYHYLHNLRRVSLSLVEEVLYDYKDTKKIFNVSTDKALYKNLSITKSRITALDLEKNLVKVNVGSKEKWYEFAGDEILIDKEEKEIDWSNLFYGCAKPKGKLQNICEEISDYKDVLWLLSLFDIVSKERLLNEYTLDSIACMEIANMWRFMSANKSLMDNDNKFMSCYNELKDELNISFNTDKIKVYRLLKNYPVAGDFEELIDELSDSSYMNILRVWFGDIEEDDIITRSAIFEKACLFSIYKKKYEVVIKINPSWRYYIITHKFDLTKYFTRLFDKLIES